MSLERIRSLLGRFRSRLGQAAPPTQTGDSELAPTLTRELLESMLLARHLDAAAHELRALGHGHYTICSSGHEANVVLGRLTRTSDPSLVHYRSAALQIERARGVSGIDPVRDIALSLVAGRDEPASGGRHKVFGHKALGIIPQTSTIASHLPRALGLAFALERSARLSTLGQGVDHARAPDAIVLASFGDASVNHSTAQGAFNAISLISHQNLPLPLLCVCEDNGLGISVRTPPGWLAERFAAMPHFRVLACDGARLAETYRIAESAVEYVRRARRPALLYLRCERLLGHAGSDVDSAYRSPQEIEAALERDPVLCAALAAIATGALSAREILELDQRAAERVQTESERAIRAPKLESREQVMVALERPTPNALLTSGERPSGGEPMTLAQGINKALAELLSNDPKALIFGEDVAKKGGVYGVTKGLFERFGKLRVWNTLLDEQTILGTALGAATLGLLPIPELQYLAYLHNAEDQLRGEAATMQFFSKRDFENPMIVRIAGLGYQKGFGGHFHNDNSLGVLRDIPGINVAVPARADDALALYRTAHTLCREAGRVLVMVEPIALYHRRGLLAEADAQWLAADPEGSAAFGRARVYHADASDLTIVSYGNGLSLSLAAAKRLERERGIAARVLDLRWIAPLPLADVLTHGAATGRVLVVDECRRSGNVSEALAAAVLDSGANLKFKRVTSADSFIPLGDAASLVLLGEDEIVAAAIALCA
ncbi:MAG TPA: thiamine pyrophosphate-dependent enzyme [Polyangiaceae bacterium]|jgi:2-oxoisovalerate dehydrogenase E1 component